MTEELPDPEFDAFMTAAIKKASEEMMSISDTLRNAENATSRMFDHLQKVREHYYEADAGRFARKMGDEWHKIARLLEDPDPL